MRLGKDVLEADLYGELGVLPDATESELRVAYRRRARASHPDLNQADPDAAPRMKRLNVAARVLLDPALRRAYDRARCQAAQGRPSSRPSAATKPAAWYDRRTVNLDSDWVVPPAEVRASRSAFGNFFHDLRTLEGRVTLWVQERIESLSGLQQVGVAALLFVVAVGLFVVSRPLGKQPTSVDATALYP